MGPNSRGGYYNKLDAAKGKSRGKGKSKGGGKGGKSTFSFFTKLLMIVKTFLVCNFCSVNFQGDRPKKRDRGKGKGETEAEKKEKTRLFRPDACPIESLDGIVALTTADANVTFHFSP